MNKIDKIISIVRQLREEGAVGGMTTGSSGPIAGFSALSPAGGPTAGTTNQMGKVQKRYAKGGIGSRRNWLRKKNPPQ